MSSMQKIDCDGIVIANVKKVDRANSMNKYNETRKVDRKVDRNKKAKLSTKPKTNLTQEQEGGSFRSDLGTIVGEGTRHLRSIPSYSLSGLRAVAGTPQHVKNMTASKINSKKDILLQHFAKMAGDAVRKNISFDAGNSLETSIKELLNFLSILILLLGKGKMNEMTQSISLKRNMPRMWGTIRHSPTSEQVDILKTSIKKVKKKFDDLIMKTTLEKKEMIGESEKLFYEAMDNLVGITVIYNQKFIAEDRKKMISQLGNSKFQILETVSMSMHVVSEIRSFLQKLKEGKTQFR